MSGMQNIDLNGYHGLCLSYENTSHDAQLLLLYSLVYDVPVLRVKNSDPLPEKYVPVGSVEWCERFLSYQPVPDYYPSWCSDILHRKVWKSDKWIYFKKLFVKPSDRYKRFNGYVTSKIDVTSKRPPYIWSEVVEFVDEWRYYITNGKVVFAQWYIGKETFVLDVVPPEFPVAIPTEYCGAVDLGRLKDGRLALVEAHHPFACGWYGTYNTMNIYFQWLIDGWKYMQTL